MFYFWDCGGRKSSSKFQFWLQNLDKMFSSQDYSYCTKPSYKLTIRMHIKTRILWSKPVGGGLDFCPLDKRNNEVREINLCLHRYFFLPTYYAFSHGSKNPEKLWIHSPMWSCQVWEGWEKDTAKVTLQNCLKPQGISCKRMRDNRHFGADFNMVPDPFKASLA